MRAEKDSIGEWYRGVPLSAKWPIFTRPRHSCRLGSAVSVFGRGLLH